MEGLLIKGGLRLHFEAVEDIHGLGLVGVVFVVGIFMRLVQKERPLDVAVAGTLLFFFFHLVHCLLLFETLREVLELFLVRSELILELQRAGLRHYLLS